MIDKIKKLHGEREKTTDASQLKAIENKLRYLYAKKCNALTAYREREIATRVAAKYSLDKQIEILLNCDISEITALKAYRSQAAAEVDKSINQFETELNNSGQS